MAEWVQEESDWLIRPPLFQMSPGVSLTRNPGELVCAQGGATLRPEQTGADFSLLGHILGFVSNSPLHQLHSGIPSPSSHELER